MILCSSSLLSKNQHGVALGIVHGIWWVVDSKGVFTVPSTNSLDRTFCDRQVLLDNPYLLTITEMHRTQSIHEDAFTFKVFIFQFVNFYSSPFYVAFFKGRWEDNFAATSSISIARAHCPGYRNIVNNLIVGHWQCTKTTKRGLWWLCVSALQICGISRPVWQTLGYEERGCKFYRLWINILWLTGHVANMKMNISYFLKPHRAYNHPEWFYSLGASRHHFVSGRTD